MAKQSSSSDAKQNCLYSVNAGEVDEGARREEMKPRRGLIEDFQSNILKVNT